MTHHGSLCCSSVLFFSCFLRHRHSPWNPHGPTLPLSLATTATPYHKNQEKNGGCKNRKARWRTDPHRQKKQQKKNPLSSAPRPAPNCLCNSHTSPRGPPDLFLKVRLFHLRPTEDTSFRVPRVHTQKATPQRQKKNKKMTSKNTPDPLPLSPRSMHVRRTKKRAAGDPAHRDCSEWTILTFRILFFPAHWPTVANGLARHA